VVGEDGQVEMGKDVPKEVAAMFEQDQYDKFREVLRMVLRVAPFDGRKKR
jgi:hypothetical protein